MATPVKEEQDDLPFTSTTSLGKTPSLSDSDLEREDSNWKESIESKINSLTTMIANMVSSRVTEESDSSISDMFVAPRKLATAVNQLVIASAPPAFEVKFRLNSPYDTFMFMLRYNEYKLKHPSVASTMALISFIPSTVICGPLGLREAYLEGKVNLIPDAMITQRIYRYWQSYVTDPTAFCLELKKVPFSANIQFTPTHMEQSLLPVYEYLLHIDQLHRFLVHCAHDDSAIPDEGSYDRQRPTTTKYIIHQELQNWMSIWEVHVFDKIRKHRGSWASISTQIVDIFRQLEASCAPNVSIFNTHQRVTKDQTKKPFDSRSSQGDHRTFSTERNNQQDQIRKQFDSRSSHGDQRTFSTDTQQDQTKKWQPTRAPNILKRPEGYIPRSLNALDTESEMIGEQDSAMDPTGKEIDDYGVDDAEAEFESSLSALLLPNQSPATGYCYNMLKWGHCKMEKSGCPQDHDRAKLEQIMLSNIKKMKDSN